MLITSITLYNYRLYQGSNTIRFENKSAANLFVVTGQNGFGKTTFLHSLLWCLYGKLMADIDDSLKREISNRGGYNSWLTSNLNTNSRQLFSSLSQKELLSIKKNGFSSQDENVMENSYYSVAVEFSNVYIPSTPCKNLRILRKYDYVLNKESVEILIDGMPNELTSEIGDDVFINDFILNKDVARFFFFDSEKIVSLAETDSTEEKRKLSSAYNEVLGVKKYEDLKKNLENLRLRFRRKSTDIESRDKLNGQISRREELQNLSKDIESRIAELEHELSSLRVQNEDFQMQLLREGNGVSISELHRQEALVATTKQKDVTYKQQIKTFLDYAPFAIAGKLFQETKKQVENDFASYKSFQEIQSVNEMVESIVKDMNLIVNRVVEDTSCCNMLKEEISHLEEKYSLDDFVRPQLISATLEEFQEFNAIYNNVTSTYRSEFEHLADDYKKNKQILDRASRKISTMQNNENDAVIKSIRCKKNEVEKQLNSTESQLRQLFEKKGSIGRELSTTQKLITELSKKVSVDDSDSKKDNLSEELIVELDAFLHSLKQEKKISLEKRIKDTLNALMHKTDFVDNVRVNIFEEYLDIDLFNKQGEVLSKDSLSKGEQQLYATSLLKALVEESGIEFPVFIDSPLQKFDKSHSKKIITEFYPTISKQVVLFPLLHKELTAQEYGEMLPLINATYLIKNDNSHSWFHQIEPQKLMEE